MNVLLLSSHKFIFPLDNEAYNEMVYQIPNWRPCGGGLIFNYLCSISFREPKLEFKRRIFIIALGNY